MSYSKVFGALKRRLSSPIMVAVLLGLLVVAGVGLKSLQQSRWGGRQKSEIAKIEIPTKIFSTSNSTTKDSVMIDLKLKTNVLASNFGQQIADVELSVKDTISGEPLRERQLLAWLSKETSSDELSAEACTAGIRERMSGDLTAPSSVNLNSWFLFAMNNDNTLSIINPQMGFTKTKLKEIVTLAGYPVDWAVAANQQQIFVSIPAKGIVSQIDTFKGRVMQNIVVGGKPVRVRAAANNGPVLVGDDDSDLVHIISQDDPAIAAAVSTSISVGDGHKEIVISPRGDRAVLTALESSEAVVVDLPSGNEVRRFKVEVGIVSGDMSDSHVYLLNERTGKLLVHALSGEGDAKIINLTAGVAPMKLSPNGRWLFVASPKRGVVDIIDTASHAIRFTVDRLAAPDQISFTEHFGYVRSTGKPGVTLVQLASLERSGVPAVSEIQAGTKDPIRSSDIGISSAMVSNPDGSGMIISNPADQSIYIYQEGMMAPAGTLKNYGREPRAILTTDWSLKETSAGVHTTQAQFPISGRYDAFVLLSQPRIGTCMKIDVPAGMAMPGLESKGVTKLSWKHSWSKDTRIKVGEEMTFKFTASLLEGEGVVIPEANDIELRLFTPPVGPATNVVVSKNGNDFEARFKAPMAGQLTILIAMPSKGIDYSRTNSVTIGVVEAPIRSASKESGSATNGL
jgi:DNA-binding beta-propeller fold protein YncE